MSDLGLLSLKLNQASIYLRQVNNAIDILRNLSEGNDAAKKENSSKLLQILLPIKQFLGGEFVASPSINERSVIEILQQKHTKNWVEFQSQINVVINKLENLKFELTSQDIDCLDDVADALDAECAQLFRRMNGRL